MKKKTFLKLASLSLISASLLISTPALARKFPHGCREIGFNFVNDNLILTPTPEEGSQTLYLIHNMSHDTLKMSIVKTKKQFFVPSYANDIDSGNWAAFATDQTEMKFQCASKGPYDDEEGRRVSCQHSIELCQYNRAKFAAHNGGNYWIAKNSPQKKVVKIAIKRGILLRW